MIVVCECDDDGLWVLTSNADVISLDYCIGEFVSTDGILSPRVVRYPPYSFDNIAYATLALFEVASLEGAVFSHEIVHHVADRRRMGRCVGITCSCKQCTVRIMGGCIYCIVLFHCFLLFD